MSAGAAFLLGAALGGTAVGLLARRLALDKTRRCARLLSFALHELNTPVTAVNMTVLNLLSGVFGELPPEPLKWVGMTRDQLGRMNALVGELRDLVHLELNQELRAVLRPEDPAGIVDDALVALRSGFAQAGVELSVELEPGLPKVRTDAERAARSLSSLLHHARKFRAGGGVSLRSRRDGAWVEFEVRYQGRPLPPGEAAASLELFYPARPRKDQILCAAGLGLGLVRAVGERLGAALGYESDEGGAARLTLRLPVARDEREGEA